MAVIICLVLAIVAGIGAVLDSISMFGMVFVNVIGTVVVAPVAVLIVTVQWPC